MVVVSSSETRVMNGRKQEVPRWDVRDLRTDSHPLRDGSMYIGAEPRMVVEMWTSRARRPDAQEIDKVKNKWRAF